MSHFVKLFSFFLLLCCSANALSQTTIKLTNGGTGWEEPLADIKGKKVFYINNESLYLHNVKAATSTVVISGNVQDASISKTGRFSAFISDGDPLGTNADGNDEVFLHDLKLDRTIQVTTTGSSFDSDNPSVNSNGKFVAFLSDADIVGANADGNNEVFLYDVVNDTFTQITDTSAGVENDDPTLTTNAKYIYFNSDGNPVGNNADGNTEIFRYVRKNQTIEQLTNTTDGDMEDPMPSKTGRFIVFESDSDQLSGANLDGNGEIYRLDTVKGVILRLTNNNFGAESPSISGNGKYVTFESDGDPFGSNADGSQELFLVQIGKKTLTTTQITAGAVGTVSRRAVLNNSAKRLYLQSDADLTGDGAGTDHIFQYLR